MKTSKAINIIYLIIFIIFFTGLFPFVETLQEKSNKKRLLKKEVNAISGLIKKRCFKQEYDSKCSEIILANYIESRKRLFGDIDNYIELTKIVHIKNEFPKNIGVDENNFFNKNYNLPFHKYYKFLGMKTFLELYSTSSPIYNQKNGKYDFIIGTMDQLKLTKSIIFKSISYLILLILVLVIYIKYFKDRIDCPFFYESRERVTTKYVIFLICISSLLVISKEFFEPYQIQDVYPWILKKMNLYKIYEFIFYIASLLGFLLFYIFRNEIKTNQSYSKIVKDFSIKLLKRIGKDEK